MKWIAEAPSNLALIKYMGKQGSLQKKDSFMKNVPLNSSLSYTLNHLKTKVEITELTGFVESVESVESVKSAESKKSKRLMRTARKDQFLFKPLSEESDLSAQGKEKFLNFFKFLKKTFSIPEHYQITSQNNFPHSSGVASSASSFATLTLATYELAKDRSRSFKPWSVEKLSELSSWGSGSSCRSFFSPWALWEVQGVKSSECFPWQNLTHELIIVDSDKKKISSTEAHTLIKTSTFFKDRPQRAEERLKELLKAFHEKSWVNVYEIVKEEFLDLHRLFETSSPSFSYQTPDSQNILKKLFHFWEQKGDGPLITMDAGSCIHLLYRSDQEQFSREIKEKLTSFSFLSSGFKK